MKEVFSKGVAFILEGATEKVFYIALLEHFCKKHTGYLLEKRNNTETGEVFYVLSCENYCVIIKLYVVGTISQVTNSGIWFQRACYEEHKSTEWTVFLCYDTDSYTADISKFHEGDWKELRNSLGSSKAKEIIDLAAQADIEDIMLVDEENIFSFLEIEPRAIPSGRKGKVKMKNLFRDAKKAYHAGDRAKALVEVLNFDKLVKDSPVELSEVERVCFMK